MNVDIKIIPLSKSDIYFRWIIQDADELINKINEKFITFEASEIKKFYSFRDISGNLKINFRELGVNRYGYF